MTENEIIEITLSKIAEHNGSPFFVGDFIVSLLEDGFFTYNQYVDRLEALGLARPTDPRHAMVITDHGRQVIKFGGWLKYLEQQEAEKLKADQIAELEAKLVRSNLETNDLNNKISKANIWFAVINVLALLINLYIALKSA